MQKNFLELPQFPVLSVLHHFILSKPQALLRAISLHMIASITSAGLPGGYSSLPGGLGREGCGGFEHYTVWKDSGIARVSEDSTPGQTTCMI